ncbi:MAG: hypothetical protein Q7R30_16915 [Acidobacteriota bacterium]|nr:hypothetical protein [Acidobacteriota bacterium]
MFNKTNWLLIWLMLLLAACAQAPESLSNAQAEELIKAHLNRPELFVALGDVRFVTGDEDLYKGRESVTRRDLYQELADAKLITLTNQRDLTGGFSGWGDFFELSQAGVRATATVAATAKGQALHDAQGDGAYQGAPNVLRIRVGTYEPLEIVSNDLITSAQKEHYRVVVATDDFFPNPELSEIPPEGGHWAVSKERASEGCSSSTW